jgi:hypothetical protein
MPTIGRCIRRKTRVKEAELAKRLASLTVGLPGAKVPNDRELVVEFEDGTRLFVRGDERLEVSVT